MRYALHDKVLYQYAFINYHYQLQITQLSYQGETFTKIWHTFRDQLGSVKLQNPMFSAKLHEA